MSDLGQMRMARGRIAPWIIPAGIGLLGSLLGGRGRTQTSNQNSTSTSQQQQAFQNWLNNVFQQIHGSTTNFSNNQFSQGQQIQAPFFTGAAKGLGDDLLDVARGNLARSLPQGFLQSGIRNINDTFDMGTKALEADSINRGIDPSASGTIALQAPRLRQIADFRTQVPLIQQDRQRMAFQDATNLMPLFRGTVGADTRSTFGSGTSTTQGFSQGSSQQQGGGTSTSSGTTTGSGSSSTTTPGQGIAGILPLLMWLYGSGAFGGGGVSTGAPGIPTGNGSFGF